jgi:hypothetical protein
LLDVIGTDAAGLAALAPRSLVLLRDAELLLAPARLLGQLEPWWRTDQAEGRIPAELPCHERLASDRPEEIYGPLGRPGQQPAGAGAGQLPEREQDALAAILLEEMESEERWSALFADSLNLLERMANEAIQDFQAGRVQPIDQLQ